MCDCNIERLMHSVIDGLAECAKLYSLVLRPTTRFIEQRQQQ